MKKRNNKIIIASIILLLILAMIPSVCIFITAIRNMTGGFVFDFRGTRIYGINAFIRTFILYIWFGFPIIALQFLLIIVSVVLSLFIKRE